MTLEAIVAGVGAVVAAALGVVLVVREFRRRDRRASIAEIAQLSATVHALRADSIAYRRWGYDVAVQLTAAGIVVPPAPPPSEAEL